MESTAQQIGVRELLEAGVHFGHQAKRWNPKMKKFIFAQRAGVHIIDLDQTLTLLDRALAFAKSIGEAGREILFVGTKKQAQLTIAEQAMRSGQPYVAERYIGGMLTNFQTIQPRIQYFKDLAVRVDETPEEDRSGKDWFAMTREFQKLRRNFAGLTEMERLPGAIFVVDPKREELLVKEANRLRIPVVALTDTNCDPEVVDYIIPGNDDAIRSINLISKLMADAVLEGKGEDEVHPEDRLVPPAVEEARVAEEIAAGNAANGSSADSAPSAEAPSAEAPSAESEEPAAPEPEAADVAVVEDAEVPVEVEAPEAVEVEALAEEVEVAEPEPTVEVVPEDAPDTEAEVTDVTASEAPEIADEEAEADEAEAREVAASVEEVDEPVEAPAADEADSGEAAAEEQAEADEEGNTEEQEEER